MRQKWNQAPRTNNQVSIRTNTLHALARMPLSTPSLTLHVSHTKSGLISHSFLPKALKKKMMLSHRAVKKPQCAALFRLLSYFLLSALCVPCRARRMPSMDGRLSLLGSSLQGIHGSRGGLASPDSDSDGQSLLSSRDVLRILLINGSHRDCFVLILLWSLRDQELTDQKSHRLTQREARGNKQNTTRWAGLQPPHKSRYCSTS